MLVGYRHDDAQAPRMSSRSCIWVHLCIHILPPPKVCPHLSIPPSIPPSTHPSFPSSTPSILLARVYTGDRRERPELRYPRHRQEKVPGARRPHSRTIRIRHSQAYQAAARERHLHLRQRHPPPQRRLDVTDLQGANLRVCV